MDNRQKACLAIILALRTIRRVNCKRWMKDWLKKRNEYSLLVLLKEISLFDMEDFKNYFRVDENTFNRLLQMVEPFLNRKDGVVRRSISVKERLALTLRYLAVGRNFEDLKFSAVISPASISIAVIESCETLIYVLQHYLKFPSTPREWSDIAKEFGIKHKFWNTLGSLDGKHVAITKPNNSGSLYYNYKGFNSIMLLALVNANKEFIMVDAEMKGRISDGVVMFPGRKA